MEKRVKADIEKLINLLEMKNSVDFSGNINVPIQVAIQSKLIQIAKKKLGLYPDKLGFFNASASIGNGDAFEGCSIPRSVCSYGDSAKERRLEYFMFWPANSTDDIYYNEIFPDSIVDDILFLTYTWLLEMDGTCVTDSPALEELVKDTIEEFQDEEDVNERVKRLAYLLRQMDFYFSGVIGPVVEEVSEYIDSLYYFAGEILPREEIAIRHDIFSLIYAYGSENLVSIVSSEDTAEYYKYRNRIPDSDKRKQLADRAVDIFLHPISSDKENSWMDSWDTVIEKPDRHIVICYYGENDYSDHSTASLVTNPFYVDALQIVDTLLPKLEEEYSEKNNRQEV